MDLSKTAIVNVNVTASSKGLPVRKLSDVLKELKCEGRTIKIINN